VGSPELIDFTELTKLTEDQTPRKVKPPRKRGFLLPQPTPAYKLSTTPVVWNISTGQLGLAAWLCSLAALVHLLVS